MHNNAAAGQIGLLLGGSYVKHPAVVHGTHIWALHQGWIQKVVVRPGCTHREMEGIKGVWGVSWGVSQRGLGHRPSCKRFWSITYAISCSGPSGVVKSHCMPVAAVGTLCIKTVMLQCDTHWGHWKYETRWILKAGSDLIASVQVNTQHGISSYMSFPLFTLDFHTSLLSCSFHTINVYFPVLHLPAHCSTLLLQHPTYTTIHGRVNLSVHSESHISQRIK